MQYTKREMLAIGGHEGARADGTPVVFLPNMRKLLSIDVTLGKNGGITSATMESSTGWRQTEKSTPICCPYIST